jgi:hypothetical protein
MVRTQIQLTEEQAKTLKRIAEFRHLSVAELIRSAVDRMIKSSLAVDIEERRQRAMDIVGRFKSGKHDVSSNHDTYLEDAYRK